MLKPVFKIDLPDWMCGEEVRKLLLLIGDDQGDPQSLFVGGCVRNAVLEVSETDIDIATKYKPEELIKILEDGGIKTIPTMIIYSGEEECDRMVGLPKKKNLEESLKRYLA